MISREDVVRIAGLANLDLTDDEIETMRGELSRILDFVEELTTLDLPDIPMERLHGGAELPLREDREVPFPADDLIDRAPSSRGRFYEVPIIIREGESNDA